MRELHEGNGTPRFPAVADELSGRALSGQRSTERCEDDERASQRTAREYSTIFSPGRCNFRFSRQRDKRLTLRDLKSRGRTRYAIPTSSTNRSREWLSNGCSFRSASFTASCRSDGSSGRSAGIISTNSTRRICVSACCSSRFYSISTTMFSSPHWNTWLVPESNCLWSFWKK